MSVPHCINLPDLVAAARMSRRLVAACCGPAAGARLWRGGEWRVSPPLLSSVPSPCSRRPHVPSHPHQAEEPRSLASRALTLSPLSLDCSRSEVCCWQWRWTEDKAYEDRWPHTEHYFICWIHSHVHFFPLPGLSNIYKKIKHWHTHITHVMCKVFIAAYQTITFYLGIYCFCL